MLSKKTLAIALCSLAFGLPLCAAGPAGETSGQDRRGSGGCRR